MLFFMICQVFRKILFTFSKKCTQKLFILGFYTKNKPSFLLCSPIRARIKICIYF